jgi:hypothetical protein
MAIQLHNYKAAHYFSRAAFALFGSAASSDKLNTTVSIYTYNSGEGELRGSFSYWII